MTISLRATENNRDGIMAKKQKPRIVDIYEILDVSAQNTKTPEALKKAWGSAVQLWHSPDHLRAKFPSSTPEDLATLAKRKSKDLDAIRQLIGILSKSEVTKAKYDQILCDQKRSEERTFHLGHTYFHLGHT